MRCTLARDDIPLLSQWVKNRQVETCRFLSMGDKKDIFAFCNKVSNSNAKSRHSRGYHQFRRNCPSTSTPKTHFVHFRGPRDGAVARSDSPPNCHSTRALQVLPITKQTTLARSAFCFELVVQKCNLLSLTLYL